MDISRLKELSGIQVNEVADKYEYAEGETFDIIDRKLKFAELMKGHDDVTKTLKEIGALVDKLLASNRAEEKEKAGETAKGKRNREPAEDRVFHDIKKRVEQAVSAGSHENNVATIKGIRADMAKLREIQRGEKQDNAEFANAEKNPAADNKAAA